MDVQDKSPNKPEVRTKPTAPERRWTRLEQLKRFDTDRLRARVLSALAAEWEHGNQPERILIRRSFARLDEPLPEGTYSDRKLPPREKRPPATRLIAPRGSAVEMYLTALYIAHCTTKAGQRPVNDRPVLPLVSDRTGRRRWSDLIAIPADSNSGAGSTYASPEDNRIRQLGGTLKRLADDDVRLVHLPKAGARKAKYEGFRLLDEAGDIVRATALPYQVPKPSEAVFGLPPAFFLRGWHMVLSDSEMALLLAVLAHVGSAGPWPPELTVQLTGATRIRFHGLSLDTYSAHKYLAAYGILEVIPDNNRRSDGTFEGQREGMRPLPHQLRVIEKGFDKDAFGLVTAALKGMGTAKPRT